MRYALSIFALLLCFGGIGAIFWYQELQYSLPTPVPANYKAIPVGHAVQDIKLVSALPEGPLFLHFYNPDCPCSRFNANHLKSLIRMYQDSIQLFIVVPSTKAKKKAINEFGKHLEYIVDEHQKIAIAHGVYATPQAVLIDRNGKLFYRGNYNKSRYCTAKASNYAELALVALLNNQRPPVFDFYATEAYGCELPERDEIAKLIFF